MTVVTLAFPHNKEIRDGEKSDEEEEGDKAKDDEDIEEIGWQEDCQKDWRQKEHGTSGEEGEIPVCKPHV